MSCLEGSNNRGLWCYMQMFSNVMDIITGEAVNDVVNPKRDRPTYQLLGDLANRLLAMYKL